MYEPNARTEEQQTSTGTGSVKTFTPPAGTRLCLISVEGSNARISMVGTAPDSTHGHVFINAQPPVTVFGNTPFKAASVDSSSSIVNVSYYQ